MANLTENDAARSAGESKILRFPYGNLKENKAKISVILKHFAQIKAYYGEAELRELMLRCLTLIEVITQSDGKISADYSKIEIFPDDGALSAVQKWEGGIAAWLYLLEIVVAIQPINTAFGQFHLLADIVLEDGSGDNFASHSAIFSEHNAPILDLHTSAHYILADKYRSDMQLVSSVFSNLTKISLGLSIDGFEWIIPICWQPVVFAKSLDSVAYYEAVLFDIDSRGQRVFLEDELNAINRLGFSHIVDHMTMNSVINELEKDPSTHICVTLSLSSLRREILCQEIYNRIERDISISSRLIINVRQDMPLTDPSNTLNNLEKFRRIGCRIAVQDFGSGYASIRQLLVLKPDIVKIENQFLHRAVNSDKDHELLAGLVAVCHAICGTLVFCGVDNERFVQFAIDCGATLLQGRALGDGASFRQSAVHASNTPPLDKFGAGTKL